MAWVSCFNDSEISILSTMIRKAWEKVYIKSDKGHDENLQGDPIFHENHRMLKKPRENIQTWLVGWFWTKAHPKHWDILQNWLGSNSKWKSLLKL